MKLRQLFSNEEERAVSPVIGVILMVAITVILAAVIGTFVLGLGDQVQQNSPNAQWTWNQESVNSTIEKVVLTHDGGDAVPVDTLSISGAGSADDLSSGSSDLTADESGFDDDDVTAGDSLTLRSDGALGADDGEVRLIWSSSSGDRTSTLATFDYEAP